MLQELIAPVKQKDFFLLFSFEINHIKSTESSRPLFFKY